MDKKMVLPWLLVITSLSSAGSFGWGYYTGAREQSRILERVGTEQMANSIGALYLLDTNDIEHTKDTLLGQASSGLDLVIEYGHLTSDDQEYIASRCRAMLRLKTFRERHKFLDSPSDSSIMKIPGMSEVEKRRRAFLDNLSCHAT